MYAYVWLPSMLFDGLPASNNIGFYQCDLAVTLGAKLAAMRGVIDAAVGHTGRVVHLSPDLYVEQRGYGLRYSCTTDTCSVATNVFSHKCQIATQQVSFQNCVTKDRCRHIWPVLFTSMTDPARKSSRFVTYAVGD